MLCPSYRFFKNSLNWNIDWWFHKSSNIGHFGWRCTLISLFSQEILEDDDQAVEAECRGFIQHMETTFGQNIESYFV